MNPMKKRKYKCRTCKQTKHGPIPLAGDIVSLADGRPIVCFGQIRHESVERRVFLHADGDVMILDELL